MHRGRVAVAVALAALGACLALGARSAPAQPPEPTSPPAAAGEESAERLFERGNASFRSGDFAAAVADYASLRDRGIASAGLLYNLGNAYLRKGDLGHAIASYERAVVLAPRDVDLRENLALSRELCADRPSRGVAAPLLFMASASRRLTADEWALALDGAYVLLLASFIAPYYVSPRRATYRRARLAVGIALVAAAGALLLWNTEFRPGRRAVVIAPEVTVRSGPGTGYLGEFTLHPGSLVHVEELRGDWVKIVFPPSLRGWTEVAGVEII